MRLFKNSIYVLMPLYLVLIAFRPCGAADDLSHLGKFCFNLVSDGSSDGGESLQFDLFSNNGRHYPLHGVFARERYGIFMTVFGTAVKDGEDIILTLTGANSPDHMESITIHAVIGISGGEYKTIKHNKYLTASESFISSFGDSGALIPYTCP